MSLAQTSQAARAGRRRGVKRHWVLVAALTTAVRASGDPVDAQAPVHGAIDGLVRWCLNGAPAPLAGANVVLVGPSPRGARTSSQGRFVFSSVPTGPQRVRVGFIGYAPQQVDVTVQAGVVTPVKVDLPGGGVAAIEVTLPASAVEVEATLQLAAVPMDCFGYAVSGAVVTWSSSDGAVATVSPSGLVTGTGLGTATIIATSEGSTAQATITVGSPGATDRIVLSSNAGADLVVALLDGRYLLGGTAQCVNDLVLFGVTGATLAANMMSPAGCRTEAATFSMGDAMLDEDDAAVVSWSDAPADAVTLDLAGPFLGVPTVIWVNSTGSADFNAKRTAIGDDLAHIQDVLDASRTGIQLTGDASGLPDIKNAGSTPLGKGCAEVGTAIAGGLHDPESFNVYYVSGVTDGRAGWYCYQYEAANVAYVDLFAAVTTLGHEIGHALGLLEPWNGHVEVMDGFPDDGSNVMWTGSGTRDHVSIGQAFRMNTSYWSWVNHSRPGGTTVREAWAAARSVPARPVRSCQCDPERLDGVCPLPRLDHPMPSGSVVDENLTPVCLVTTALPTTAPLDCGARRDVTASFFYRTVAEPARGGVLWLSRSPTVARVEETEETGPDADDHVYPATITGAAAGTATIVVYGGGPSAMGTITLSVGGPGC